MPTSAALLGANGDGDVATLVAGNAPTHHLNPHSHHHGLQIGCSFKFGADGQATTPSASSATSTTGAVPGATLNELALMSAAAATATAQNGGIEAPPMCAACDLKINDLYYLVAVGKAWHLHCLRCFACHESLNEGSCFWKSGNIYCREDYQRLFCRCAGCHNEIGAQDLIMPVVDRNDFDGRVSCLLFHLKCFQCALCHRHLERGAQFFTQGSNVYCEQHFDLCTSTSPVLLPMAPLSNNIGNDLIGSASSYVFGGEMDCDVKPSCGQRKSKTASNKSSSNRKNSGKTQQQQQQQQQLQQPVSPLQQAVPLLSSSPQNTSKPSNDLVPAAATGDNANLLIGSVPTSSQPSSLFKSRTPPPNHSQPPHPPPLMHRHSHQGLLSTVTSHHLASLPLRTPGEIGGGEVGFHPVDSSIVNHHSIDYFGSGADFGDVQNSNHVAPQPGSTSQQSGGSQQSSSGGSQQRGKRIRTSFKHTQLKIMKHYFSENHNPDAKDLKQLALKTGLSKRVLQVWFQNARAKYRRTLMKEQQKSGGMSLLGGNPFLGNSSMSDRAQSTSLLEGDSPLSNNSGGHEGLNGISSASMTIGGEDDVDMDDMDDGFQDADELESSSDRRSRAGMSTSKSPASGSGRHLSPSNGLMGMPNGLEQQQQQQQQLQLTMTPPNPNTYLMFDTAASSIYSTPPGAVDYNLGHIIQPSML